MQGRMASGCNRQRPGTGASPSRPVADPPVSQFRDRRSLLDGIPAASRMPGCRVLGDLRPARAIGMFPAARKRMSTMIFLSQLHKRLLLAVPVLAVATGATAAATAPPSPLSLACLSCHQASVDSAEMPALSSMSSASIAASLRAARDQPQTGSIMARFAAKMSDADIAALAAELGTRSGKP